MTHAIAAVAPSFLDSFTEASPPVVFIDGVPEPSLSLSRWTRASAMDANEAELVIETGADLPIEQLAGRSCAVALPHRLADGETRWSCLLEGRVTERVADLAAGRDARRLTIQGRFAALLADRADAGELSGGEALTLAMLLGHLGTLLNAEAVCACDPALTDTVVTASGSTPQTYSALLLPMLDRLGLRLEQSLAFEHGRSRRTLTLIDHEWGRRIALPWADPAGRGGAVRSARIARERHTPRQWIATGGRPVVEDTFSLQRAWDPALEGEPDSAYGRLTSSDFSVYGPVYRAWVLNEDGAYNLPPYNLGGAYDAGALFGSPGSIHTPLRFGPCLSRDASARAIGPVIESSTDAGASWSAYPGRAEVMMDRAGVVLIDDALPAAILSAAQAGTLRLRITASLTDPHRLRARRWTGNPFAGPGPTRELSLGDRYGWRYVAATSIHAGALASGTLTADTADDRRALRQALREHVEQATAPDRSAIIELDGAWPAIAPGDRAAQVLDRATRIDTQPARFEGRDARVVEVRIDFGVGSTSPRTRLTLE